MTSKIASLLSIILFFKAVAIVWIITHGSVGLGPDEAQYWTWSQKLNWGYYSKPPGIAWQIWLGTSSFGNSELGVRIGAVVIGTLLPLAIYILAATCRLQPWTCAAAAIIFALSPLGIMSSFLAITDGGLVLFWALATAAFCRSLTQPQAQGIGLISSTLLRDAADHIAMSPAAPCSRVDEIKPIPQALDYYITGAFILAGALFKWPIYLFWPLAIAWTLFQRQTISWHLFGGIALSLLGLFPSLIWNSQNDWSTFKHVSATLYNPTKIDTGTTDLMRGNFWEFIGAQAILLSPILFVLLLIAFWKIIKDWKSLSPGLQFCASNALIILGGYALISVFKKLQGNWCDFAYPAAVVILSWYMCERSTKLIRWLYIGLGLSVLLVSIFFSIPYLQTKGLPRCCPIPFKSNPFKHNLGWDKLDSGLKALGYDPDQNFLFSDRYQNSSILSFYGPNQKQAYFFNLHGIRKNQFSYWKGMEIEQLGRTGYFVAIENFPLKGEGLNIETRYQALLNPYFTEVQYIGVIPLFYSNGSLAKGALIFKGMNYNGKLPVESSLY